MEIFREFSPASFPNRATVPGKKRDMTKMFFDTYEYKPIQSYELTSAKEWRSIETGHEPKEFHPLPLSQMRHHEYGKQTIEDFYKPVKEEEVKILHSPPIKEKTLTRCRSIS